MAKVAQRSMSMEKLIDQFFDSGKKAAASNQGEVLHTFRVAAKRLRYTIEILHPHSGEEWLKLLRLIQRQLGDMNDAFVAERYLRALPSLSVAARPLPRLLHQEAEAHIAKFHKTWHRRFGERTEKAWRAWARSVPAPELSSK